MKICTKCKIEKPLTAFGKWSKRKDGLKPRCRACRAVDGAEWIAKNPDYFKDYYKNNGERIRARVSARRKTLDREQTRAYFYAYYRKDRRAAIERTAQWRKDNPAKYRTHVVRRVSAERAAYVDWGNRFLMDEFYDLAFRREDATGFQWHVDHVVPLISKLVCGLHVEHNLAVIPASENTQKGNRYWPDMP